MTINAQTKIAGILKHRPAALDVIVSISPVFVKLRNPFLRKLMASRTSIEMAAKLGHCNVEDFFLKLEPLGFVIGRTAARLDKTKGNDPVPDFLKRLPPDRVTELDVRSVLERGGDPLNSILQHVKVLPTGHVLRIVNTFEPTPLIKLLNKQGFEAYVEEIGAERIDTWFYRESAERLTLKEKETGDSPGWEEVMGRFTGRTQTIDVRQLEMPLPLHAILEALATLPEGWALFVYHKRVPVFLLDELQQRRLCYRIREITETEVRLFIYTE